MQEDTRDPTVAVFGGRSAKGLAMRLSSDRTVRLLSADRSVVESSRSAPFEARHVDYRSADLSEHVAGAAAIVAADRDRIGLLVAQKLAASGAADRILVRLNDPEYEAAFDDIDCELLDFGSVLHETVESHLGPTPA
jgi:Trk K+ transport system NAD-binding subunit